MYLLTKENGLSKWSQKVKGLATWGIQESTWNKDNGIQLRVPLVTLKDMIEDKFKNSNPHGLGNLLRKYIEQTLKQLNYNFNAKLPFKYNNENEKRSLKELYDGFVLRLNKKKQFSGRERRNQKIVK